MNLIEKIQDLCNRGRELKKQYDANIKESICTSSIEQHRRWIHCMKNYSNMLHIRIIEGEASIASGNWFRKLKAYKKLKSIEDI